MWAALIFVLIVMGLIILVARLTAPATKRRPSAVPTSTPKSGQRKPAPVIDAPGQRGHEKVFRRSDDPPHVYRINQKPPKGLRKKLANYVPVVGVSRGQRPERMTDFIFGSERRIELKREPDNPADPNAIAVIGHWTEAGVERSGQLGYLSREVARKLAKAKRIGATVEAMYAGHGSKSPGIRLDVWGPAKKPRRVKEKPYDPSIAVPDDPVERNVRGRELEREGLVDNAIEFYEANVRDGFDGSFPYRRLAIIYRRRKEYGKEVAVLEKLIESLSEGDPRYVAPKLAKFRKRLRRAEELRG